MTDLAFLVQEHTDLDSLLLRHPAQELHLAETISNWMLAEIDPIAQKRYGKKADRPKVQFVTDFASNIAGTSGPRGKIRLAAKLTFPDLFQIGTHERIHCYFDHDNHTAAEILDDYCKMFKENQFVNNHAVRQMYQDLATKGYESIVKLIMNEYFAYSETPWILGQVKIPLEVSVKSSLDLDAERLMYFARQFGKTDAKEVKISPDTFFATGYETFLRYFQVDEQNPCGFETCGTRMGVFLEYIQAKAVSSITLPFSQYARLRLDIQPPDVLTMKPAEFVQAYNDKVDQVKAS